MERSEGGFAAIEIDYMHNCWNLLVWERISWGKCEAAPQPDHIIPLDANSAQGLLRSAADAHIPEGQSAVLVAEEVRYLRSLIDKILPSALRESEPRT